jgi:hypothetical protein
VTKAAAPPPHADRPGSADPPFAATAVKVVVVEAIVLAALLAFQFRFGS